jgi:hypothetical protein
MTSFAFRLEPAASPRLAGAAALLHAAAAASPWLLGVRPEAAAGLSAVAALGLLSTLAALPGRHHALDAIAVDAGGWRARFAGTPDFVAAEPGKGSRVARHLAVVELWAGARRCTWLLPRGSLPPGSFRRLKARLRFSC